MNSKQSDSKLMQCLHYYISAILRHGIRDGCIKPFLKRLFKYDFYKTALVYAASDFNSPTLRISPLLMLWVSEQPIKK